MPVFTGTRLNYVMASKPTLSLAELEALDPDNRPNAKERRFACPRCDDQPRKGDRRALALNTDTGLWVCHRCGDSGKLTDKWEERPKLSRKERVRAQLQKAYGLAPRREPDLPPEDAEWRPWLARAVPLAGTPGEAYLAGRGISRDLAAAAGVLYVARWYKRPAVLYPLKDAAGVVMAVGGRFLDDLTGKPKPWDAKQTYPKTQVGGKLSLGAFATPGAFDGGTVVIVEGPADALSLALCGTPAVALHQTNAAPWVVQRCAFKRVLVALDADKAGDDGSDKLIGQLRQYGATPERVRPPDPKDWNDALLARGADGLQRYIFDCLAGPPYQAAYRRRRADPHNALEAAIDAADLAAFTRELAVYESGGAPAQQLEMTA